MKRITLYCGPTQVAAVADWCRTAGYDPVEGTERVYIEEEGQSQAAAVWNVCVAFHNAGLPDPYLYISNP